MSRKQWGHGYYKGLQDGKGRSAIEPGFVVEILTHDMPSISEMVRSGNGGHGHVGEVQIVCPMGIRITYLDWFSGSFEGFDCFIPWEEVRMVRIATKEHNMECFIKSIQSRLRNG